MKNLVHSVCVGLTFLIACGPGAKPVEKAENAALCDFTPTDSATAQAKLQGEWELAGIQTNYMNGQPNEFLTGQKIGTPKRVGFYGNTEFVQTLGGSQEGQRQPYKIEGEGITPLAYRFWFCGENTLVLSNLAADGPTEVYIRK